MFDEQNLLVHIERQQDMRRHAENERMARQLKSPHVRVTIRQALGKNLVTLGQQLLGE